MAQKKKPKKSPAKAQAKAKSKAKSTPARRKAIARRRPVARTKDSPQVAEIRAVIDVMMERGAVEVELESKGTRIRVRLKEDNVVPMVALAQGSPSPGTAPTQASAYGSAPPAAPTDPAPEHHVFHSPMVGTFYRSSSPESEAFVEVGSRVGPESTLCILEAMKVMNEIKAEVSGTVVRALAQNGEPVEFGQPLFLLDLD